MAVLSHKSGWSVSAACEALVTNAVRLGCLVFTLALSHAVISHHVAPIYRPPAYPRKIALVAGSRLNKEKRKENHRLRHFVVKANMKPNILL